MIYNAHNAMVLIKGIGTNGFLGIFDALKNNFEFLKIVLDKLSNIWYIRIISASFLP